MNYLSVCSGIEAATVAWHPLGWSPVAFSEIEPFPSAVLKHHYPDTPNVGDMTKFKEWNFERPVDLFVGGTPCQSFSVAGLRKGLDDPRGNLMLTYLAIADKFRPTWLVWENVPGVLSSNEGQDFGTFLGGLGELGYGFAYRVLDAQYFGVAQRRRRVFVVGYLGNWRPAAAVLFERDSLCGNPAPSREAGQGTPASVAQCFEPRSPDGHARLIGDFSPTLNRMGGGQREPCVIQPISFDTVQITSALNKTRVEPGLPVSTLAKGSQMHVAYEKPIPFGVGESPDTAHCLRSGASKADKHESTTYAVQSMAVRRLTPIECERLQGFPDNYTNVPWRKSNEAPDGPRYKALGNSMAVPVMHWIGKRIKEYEQKQ